MKKFIASSRFHILLGAILGAFLFAVPGAAVAATVTMTANTTTGSNGFNPTTATGSGWPSVPVSGNDYYDPSFQIRTGTSSALSTATFPGKSLTIGSGTGGTSANLLYKGSAGGTITIADLRLNSGVISNGTGNDFVVAGNIALLAGGGTINNNNSSPTTAIDLAVSSTISGTGKLKLVNLVATGTAGNTITLLGTSSNTGGTDIGDGITPIKVIVDSGAKLGGGTIKILAKGSLVLNNTANMDDANQSLQLASSLSSAQAVALNYTGSINVASLSFDGGSTFAANGTYGSMASNAVNKSNFFSGSGTITVGLLPRGVYVGSEFYAPTTTWQDNARNCGFSRLFLFTLGVDTNGDISYNGTLVVQNGVYVGDSTWGATLAACRVAPSNVKRIEACIGSWGSVAFTNIKNLIAAQGAGPTSILYRNFKAFKDVTGVDGIQFDDEQTYDANSMAAFGNMLSSLGLRVALVPYTAQSVWVSVKSQMGARADSIYLQCYDGGAGNNPASWNTAFGGFKVMPGLWGNTDTAPSAISKMRNWRTSLGTPGGFMWLNGSLPSDAPKWSNALRAGLDPIITVANGTYKVIVRHTGMALAASGDATAAGTQLVQSTYSGSNSMRWTLTGLGNGLYKLIGVASGRSIHVDGGSGSGVHIVLGDYTGAENQTFNFIADDSGYYTPILINSGRAMNVTGASTAEGANVTQSTYNVDGAPHQQWQFLAP